jgi:hypothetical protein
VRRWRRMSRWRAAAGSFARRRICTPTPRQNRSRHSGRESLLIKRDTGGQATAAD